MEIKELYEKFSTAQAELMELAKKSQDEIRRNGEVNAELKEHLAQAGQKIEAAEKAIEAWKNRMDAIEKKIAAVPIGSGRPKSIAEKVVDSEEFIQAQKTGNMPPVNVVSFHRKDISGDVTSGGIYVPPMRVPEMQPTVGERVLHLRDVLNVGTTASNAVDFIRETMTNNAAPVEEKPEYGKPESAFTFQKVTAPVATIAHWVPATRQILSDVPMLMSYISGRLIYGLKLEEDDQILNGNGTNGAFTGILQTPNLSPAPTPDAGDTNIDMIRRMIASVRASEYPATAIVINPQDWAQIELTKATGGQYVYVPSIMQEGAGGRLWGLPVVETNAIPRGICLVGAFGIGAQLWDREQATIRISEHHAEYFTSNMIAILAEERLTLTVYRPLAFCAANLPVS